MSDKKEVQKNLEYARGYRDALVDTWEDVLKMATKGYSSHELQILAKTKSSDARRKIQQKIEELEADLAQGDIIDIDEDQTLNGVAELEPVVEVQMSPRESYLVKESKPTRCYEMLQREIGAGKEALIIARTPPQDIRKRYSIGKSQIIWLTTNEKLGDNLPPSALGMDNSHDSAGDNDEYVKPGELPKLFSIALNFLGGQSEGLIMMEGVEYLASHNKFQSMLNFLQKLNESVVQNGQNLVISVNPASFEPRQMSHLESEMSKVLG